MNKANSMPPTFPEMLQQGRHKDARNGLVLAV
jgi:hypothetical protein